MMLGWQKDWTVWVGGGGIEAISQPKGEECKSNNDAK